MKKKFTITTKNNIAHVTQFQNADGIGQEIVVTPKVKKLKWVCENCYAAFRIKSELVEHLKQEFMDTNDEAGVCADQLEYLGVKKL